MENLVLFRPITATHVNCGASRMLPVPSFLLSKFSCLRQHALMDTQLAHQTLPIGKGTSFYYHYYFILPLHLTVLCLSFLHLIEQLKMQKSKIPSKHCIINAMPGPMGFPFCQKLPNGKRTI